MKKFALTDAIGIAAIAILTSGCKKEIKEPNNLVASKIFLCTEAGDTWTPVGNYYDLYLPPSSPVNPAVQTLIYNNKHYLFRNLKIIVYDGAGWDTIPSAVPFNIGQFHNDNFSFTLGDKGYMCVTDPGNPNNSFWEYDFAANTWAQKANFPGVKREHPNYFSVGNKGYVVGGRSISPRNWNLSDVWEYDPSTNTWTKKTSLPAILGRSSATGFSIGNKGYIVNGMKVINGINVPEYIYLDDLLEYNPVTDSWAQKANFPGAARHTSSVFVISGEAYVGGGYVSGSPTEPYDFYKYTPGTNSWASIANNYYSSIDGFYFGFSINSHGYIVDSYNPNRKLYKYTPRTCIQNPSD